MHLNLKNGHSFYFDVYNNIITLSIRVPIAGLGDMLFEYDATYIYIYTYPYVPVRLYVFLECWK